MISGNNGRLRLQGISAIYFMHDTHVQITNNHAKRGGGNVSFNLDYIMYNQVKYHDSVVTLENNTADDSGSAVYEGRIDSFIPVVSGSYHLRYFSSYSKLKTFLHLCH